MFRSKMIKGKIMLVRQSVVMILASVFALASIAHGAPAGRGRPGRPARPARPERPERPERVEKPHEGRASERAEKLGAEAAKQRSNSQSQAAITLAELAGLTSSVQLGAVMRGKPYVVEVVDKANYRSESRSIEPRDLVQRLADNMQGLRTAPESARYKLGQSTAKLMTLLTRRSTSTDPDMVLARSALARHLETAVRMTRGEAKESPEAIESFDKFNQAAIETAEKNPGLSDAEIMRRTIQATRRIGDKPLTEEQAKEEMEEIKNCRD